MSAAEKALAFSPAEIARRGELFRQALEPLGLDGAIVLHRADTVYLAGASFGGAVLVPREGVPRIFAWRGAGWIPPDCPWLVEAVPSAAAFGKALAQTEFAGWKRVGFEEDVVPVALFRRMVQKTWPEAQFDDASAALRRVRAVKSAEELERVRRSGAVLAAGFAALPGIIRPGLPEFEIQAQFEAALRRAGDQAFARTRAFNAESRGIVACGESAGVDNVFDGPLAQLGRNRLTPMGGGEAEVRRDLPVIVDSTAGFGGYLTDMTRTFVCGKLEPRFTEAHDFCVAVLEGCARRMVPGAVPEEIYLWALAEAEKAGYAANFMNRGANQVRFLGHGIGLEVDETPVLARRFTDPLQEGMVIAVEPKVVYDDGAVGVEDTFIVEPGGARAVTPLERGVIRVD